MKKLIIMLSIISLSSCSKKWSCEQTITTETFSTGEIKVKVYESEFKGTSQEKNEYEEQGYTNVTTSDYSIISVVECK